jgi:hypothetical protein
MFDIQDFSGGCGVDLLERLSFVRPIFFPVLGLLPLLDLFGSSGKRTIRHLVMHFLNASVSVLRPVTAPYKPGDAATSCAHR